MSDFEKISEPGFEVGNEVHFSNFLTDSGRLSGSHLLAIANTNPLLAAHIFDDYYSNMPKEHQPAELGEALAMIEWSSDGEMLQFMEAIEKEE